MKLRTFLAASAVLVMVAACGQNNGGSSETKALLPKKAEIDSVSYLMGVNFGSFVKGYNFGEDLNFAEIKRGMVDFIKAKGDQ
ncbi:MAG: hypothetical protein J6Z20_06250, partial [Bacteroidales bacterium]|nr:hypothetical protein [Bacteroidales bacterium]